MATIREYFDTDLRSHAAHLPWKITSHDDGSLVVEVIAKIAYDIEANAKYWYFYVPAVAIQDLYACLGLLFASDDVAACRLRPEGDGIVVKKGRIGYSEVQSSSTLQFTKRVHLYLDYDLSPAIRAQLVSEALAAGYFLSIRDREYAQNRTSSETPLAFISHDSRDKDAFVRELAHELAKKSCPVWYDEYSLKVGDSLRSNIERGLKEASKCIVILSPNFFSNKGWVRAEFDSIYSREIVEKQNVMLPVWLGVSEKDVYNYSPRLLDRLGLSSNLGVEEVARRLSVVLKAKPSSPKE